MSVLNFPRIYVNGHMSWNPPTANNNDVLPLYDAVNMRMNWRFLEHFGITEANAPTRLMPWTISSLGMADLPEYVLQVPGNANPRAFPMIPAEWDLFGDNACATVNYNQIRSRVVGGQLQANNYINQDALISKPWNLFGNPFGSNTPSAARFVDVSPWQNTFTALYFDKLMLGDGQSGLTLNRQYRMLDRFLNFNWGALGGLSYVTTTWQSCFPRENLEWVIGDSVLLQNLQQQMQQQNAKGLMFRFSTYLTYYDKNGIFNSQLPVNTRSHAPADMAKLQALYQKGLDNVVEIFSNPAYSRTAGTLGLWFADEFPTAPGGRRLVPASPVPLCPQNPSVPMMTLGVIPAEVHGNTLSLDLSNGFPFYPVDGNAPVPVAERFKAGTYQIGSSQPDGSFVPAAEFGFEQYRQSAFDERSGLLDLPLSADQAATLQAGPLELRLKGIAPLTAATQQMWTAEVIESASFVDVGQCATLNIMVQYDGLPAPEGTVLWVAEYNNPYMITTSDYYLAFSGDTDFTLFWDVPSNRQNNSPNLVQFENGSIPGGEAVPAGRMFRGLASASAPDAGTPVSYRSFLSTPAAISLAPCLEFTDAVARQGTLKGNGSQVNYSLARIQTDASGIAQLKFKAVQAGFPAVRFFIQPGTQEPDVAFSFNSAQAYIDFLAPLRVLPLEPQLEQDFATFWNGIYKDTDARVQIWENFIYPKILQPFYYMYPIMNKFMPLNSLERIEGAVDQLIVLISKQYQEESTLAMPITRDLPQSRRAVLERWATALVKLNYPPRPL